MSEMLFQSSRQWTDDLLWYGLVGSIYIFIFGVGGILVASLWIANLRLSMRESILVVVASSFMVPFVFTLDPWTHVIRYWILDSWLLTGLAYGMLVALTWFETNIRQPIGWDKWIEWRDRQQQIKYEKQVLQRLKQPSNKRQQIELGAWVDGDQFQYANNLTIENSLIWADPELFDRHVLLIGSPGSGKTVALKHILKEFASKTNRHLFLIDGKGELEFGRDIQAMLQEYRQSPIPLFQMGHNATTDTYNGFKGDSEAVQQRLRAMFRVEEQQGDSEFYGNINRALLSLVCNAMGHPPQSLDELDHRFNIDWLYYAYQDNPKKMDAISRYEKWFDGARIRADSLIWDFQKYITPDGFSLDNVACAVFSLRTSAVGDNARRFFDFLVEDLKHFIGGKRQSEKTLICIDEVGQLHPEKLLALIELGRSAQAGLVLATQDLSTIENIQTRERIIGSVQTKILMKTDVPQMVGDLAGTRKHVHVTAQTDESLNLTGLGSIRLEDERKVDLNQVRRFSPGRAYLINGGEGAITQFRAPPSTTPQVQDNAISTQNSPL